MDMKYTCIVLLVCINIFAYGQKKWSLKDCIQYAQKSNIDLLKIRADNNKFAEDIDIAKGNSLPDLSFNALQGFNLGSNFNVSTGVGQLGSRYNSFSLQSSWLVYSGHSTRYKLQEAQLSYKKAQADASSLALNISLEVINQYLNVLFNKEILAIAQQQEKISTQEEKRLNRLLEQALIPRSDLLELQATVANDRKEVEIARNNLKTSLIQLAELIDVNHIADFNIQSLNIKNSEAFVLIDRPEAIYQSALDRNPYVRSAELDMALGELSILREKAQYYPSLYLTYSFSTSYYHVNGTDDVVFNQETGDFEKNGFLTQLNNNKIHFIGLSLGVPIFNRFQTKANVKKAAIGLEVNQLELRNQKNQLLNKIRIAYNDAVSAKAVFRAAEERLSYQRAAFQGVQRKFQDGLISSYEFLESKSNYIKAQSDLLVAKYECFFKLKILEYYKDFGLNPN